MANVLLVTQGTGGDLHPFIGIGRALLARGHRVTLITHERLAGDVGRAGLDFAPLDSAERVEQLKVLQTREGMAEMLSKVGETDPLVLGSCMDGYRAIADRSVPGETVVVSNQNLHLVTQTASERLGLPYIPVYLAPYFLMKLPMTEQMYASDSATMNSYRAELDLPPVSDWTAWLRGPRWKIGLWPEWFAPRDEMPCDAEAVGFISNPVYERSRISEEAEEFLSAGEPPVLVTHGTSKPHRPEFFSSAVEACAALGQRTLLVTPNREWAPPMLPEGARHFPHVPFGELLGRIRAMVHHGGIGTLHHALAAAVPQLIMGLGFDRPDNGLRVRRLGVGDYLPPARWKTAAVAQALTRVLSPEAAAQCLELAARLRGTAEAAAAVAAIVEEALSGAGADMAAAGD